jgi:hypothetical protein
MTILLGKGIAILWNRKIWNEIVIYIPWFGCNDEIKY